MMNRDSMSVGRRARAALWATALVAATTMPAFSQSVEQFYKGKTITVVIGLGAGGGYDTYARLAARWLGRHIPGSPTLVPQNMPGAGGMIAANHLYNVAPKDGTAMGALHANVAFAQVTETPNVEYDARRFNWIGRVASGGLDVHHTWHTTGVTSFDDLLKREVVVGAGGPTSGSFIFPNAVNELMGAKLKILAGYKGTAETSLALERGEIEMALHNWEALRTEKADWLRDKKINLIVQYGVERHAELSNVPTIIELAKTEEQRQIWRLLLSTSSVGYSLSMPPDVPAERVAAVRKAFDAALKDPDLQAEAKKVKRELDPLGGEKLEAFIVSMFKADRDVVAKARALLKK